MSARRSIAITLLIALAVSAFVLVGCAGPSEDATFLGYKQRPTENDPGVAIIQLANGTPAEAECSYNSLENGTPVKVTKSGDRYEIVAMSPDWGE